MGSGTGERRIAELTVEGRKWDEGDAREVLSAWEASGESGAAFARHLGIDPPRLYWWRSRVGSRPEAASSFVPVDVKGSWAAIVVTTEKGVRIEVASADAASAEWVVTVVGTLGGSGR